MKIFTDDIDFAKLYLSEPPEFSLINLKEIEPSLQNLTKDLMGRFNYYTATVESDSLWKNLFIASNPTRSQYDVLIENLNKNNLLPDGILCISGISRGLHGFRNRKWVGLPGNIHLSVYMSPMREIPDYAAGFMALAAVSTVDCIDKIDELTDKSGIKWVNDIYLENSKVCGVLSYAAVQGKTVTGAVLGIGLNVESKPQLTPTPSVRYAACLNNFLLPGSKITMKEVLPNLLDSIVTNYKKLVTGKYSELLDKYRRRSILTGSDVRIWSDPILGESEPVYRGRVEGIGVHLELILDGVKMPIMAGKVEIMEK